MNKKNISTSLAFLVIACCGISYAARLFNYGYIHGDEGIALMGGWRIFLGQIPHRDFFEFIPPFSFLLLALFFKLFGPSFFAERLLVMTYAVLLIVVSDRLLRHFTKNMLPRCMVASFLIPYGVLQWPLPSHHWVVDIAQLLALSCLLNGLHQSSLRWGIFAGICTVLGCFSMQDQGGYLAISLVLFFSLIENRGVRKKLFLGWVTGGGAVAAVFFIYLLPHVSLTELINQWVIFPATRYSSVTGNVGSLMNLGLQEIGTPAWINYLLKYPDYTIPQTFIGVLLPLLPLMCVVALCREFLKNRYSRPLLGILVSGGLAFMGGCLHRFAQTNLVWAAPILIIILAVGVANLLEFGKNWQKMSAQVFAIGMIGISLLYTEGDVRLKFSEETTRVTGAAGTLIVPARSTQSSMQIVIDSIEKNVPKDAPLFCTEYNAMINFWTLRPNPTRYNFFISPNLHTNEQIDEVINTLTKRPDAYVLLFVPFANNDRFGAWAYGNYQVAWQFPWALLLKQGLTERNSPS
jgi:hypothetical protein